jgi:hypothetical protein
MDSWFSNFFLLISVSEAWAYYWRCLLDMTFEITTRPDKDEKDTHDGVPEIDKDGKMMSKYCFTHEYILVFMGFYGCSVLLHI